MTSPRTLCGSFGIITIHISHNLWAEFFAVRVGVGVAATDIRHVHVVVDDAHSASMRAVALLIAAMAVVVPMMLVMPVLLVPLCFTLLIVACLRLWLLKILFEVLRGSHLRTAGRKIGWWRAAASARLRLSREEAADVRLRETRRRRTHSKRESTE